MTARVRGVAAAWAILSLPLSLTLLACSAPAYAQGDLPSFVDERRLPQNNESPQKESQDKLQRLQQEQERLKAETEARRKAEEEAERQRALQEEKANQAAAEQQRKAGEEAARQRAAEEEERARQAAEAERQRQAEEEAARKRAAEEEARARQAAEAERQRRAEEEAARQRAAEEEERARQAAEAERQRQAEEEAARQRAAEEEERARQAAEVERKRQAAEEAARQRAAAQQREAGNAAAGQLAGRMAGGTACRNVELKGTPQPAARIEIKVVSECLAGRSVIIAYGNYEFVRKVGADGTMTMLLDMFEANAPLALKLDDGTTMNIDTTGVDYSGISKVAVLWTAPVNLDLHAHEYLAPRGTPGHVWSKAPGSLENALQAAGSGKRARGFISMDDNGKGPGLHAEVYTFLHNPAQRNGAITLLIDYETRGDVPEPPYCGDGELAQIEAHVMRLRPGGGLEKETVRLGPAPCGQKIPEAQRFNSDTLSDLVAKG